MRRPRLLISLSALAVLAVVADSSAQFAIGAAGGVYRTNLWGDKPSNSTYQSAFTISGSAIFEYRISSDISLTVQPGFKRGGSNLGYKPPLGGGEVIDSASVRLNYFSVPALARVVTEGAFFVSSGPVFGRLLSASGKLEGNEESTDLKDRFESGDLGFAFGVGKLIPKGDLTTVVEFRIVWGFANVGITSSDQSRVRTGGMQLIFGAQYKLGG